MAAGCRTPARVRSRGDCAVPHRSSRSRRRAPRSGRPSLAELVIYELHVGTFTSEGTFDAMCKHLAELAQLGITAIEIMPVAEFPGSRGWGYDGVYLSAAQSSYGGPKGLQRLVQAALANGLAVILDVVYNHVGAPGRQGSGGIRAILHRSTRRRGDERSTMTMRTAIRSGVGAAKRHRVGSRLRDRRPAARRDPCDLRFERRAHRRGDRRGGIRCATTRS